jgi:hypothetical protein
MTPARISPTIAGCPIRLKISSPIFAASRTTKRSVTTAATSVVAARGRASSGEMPVAIEIGGLSGSSNYAPTSLPGSPDGEAIARFAG